MYIYGNSSGNIMNSGIALECSKGKFYVGNDFYVYRNVNEKKSLFLNVKARYLNYWDGYIYFTNDKFEICRVDIDRPQSIEILVPQICYCVNIMNDSLYFRNASNDKKLYRANMTGGDCEMICDHSSLFLNAYGGKLYFCESESYNLYVIDSDGQNLKKLSEDKIYYPNIVEDGIIYSDKSLNGVICKMDLEGKNVHRIFTGAEAYYLNVYRNKVYFRNYSDRMSLWCYDVFTKQAIKLYDSDIFQINCMSDGLYFCEKASGGRIQHMEMKL